MDIHALLRLSAVPRIGPQKIRALIAHFRTPQEVLKAPPRELIRVTGIERKLASAIAHFRDGQRFADDQMRRMQRSGARVVTYWDEEFPDLLRKTYDPPALLFVLGSFTPADAVAVAIVGTRAPSPYGEQTAARLAEDLARSGITSVSGLARGIDTVAHVSALSAGGRTIAVIGSGLDVPYPPENRRLMEKIAATAAVASEVPMGTKPDAVNFPRRNRVISGLSLGTVVVESAEDGGAMITASMALDQDREVFAVPGCITERRSVGPNRLIQRGHAKLILGTEDVLEELRLHRGPGARETPAASADLTLFERSVYDALGTSPIHIDTLAAACGLSTSDTLVSLLTLEFKGLVRQTVGKMFSRT